MLLDTVRRILTWQMPPENGKFIDYDEQMSEAHSGFTVPKHGLDFAALLVCLKSTRLACLLASGVKRSIRFISPDFGWSLAQLLVGPLTQTEERAPSVAPFGNRESMAHGMGMPTIELIKGHRHTFTDLLIYTFLLNLSWFVLSMPQTKLCIVSCNNLYSLHESLPDDWRDARDMIFWPRVHRCCIDTDSSEVRKLLMRHWKKMKSPR